MKTLMISSLVLFSLACNSEKELTWKEAAEELSARYCETATLCTGVDQDSCTEVALAWLTGNTDNEKALPEGAEAFLEACIQSYDDTVCSRWEHDSVTQECHQLLLLAPVKN